MPWKSEGGEEENEVDAMYRKSCLVYCLEFVEGRCTSFADIYMSDGI